MRRLRWLATSAAGALILALAPAAHATIVLTADATLDKGYVRLSVVGSSTLTDVRVGELVRGRFAEIRPLALQPFGTFEGYGALSREQVPRAARWRCDRVDRVFQAVGTNALGARETSEFMVRTPSCANRLRLAVPPRAREGRVRIRLEDTFRRGAAAGRLCHRTAGAPPRCRTLTVPAGERFAATTLRLRREGRWRVDFVTPYQRIRRVVAVGVPPRPADLERLPGIVATGDSLMQGLDAVLEDRLTGLATVSTDVRIGSGLGRVINADWSKLPRRQVREYRPAATVMFLGSNDGAPLREPGGRYAGCCGERWVQAYARRVRDTMRAYVRGGRGRVYWLSLPAARDDLRSKVNRAVNRAVAQAAPAIRGATVLDMAAVFTPDGRFTSTITYRGRRERVRQQDGIHLTTRGAQIAADHVIDRLEQDGVL